MSTRINYPAAWSQADRGALDALFERARASKLWFFHGGLSGPLWFSPDELEADQKKGKFIWGASNWTLRDPAEALASIDTAVAKLQEAKQALMVRIARSQ
jgi:hypothetical protein